MCLSRSYDDNRLLGLLNGDRFVGLCDNAKIRS